ncbi:YtxH domain-containing protein [Hymenobacter sp. H14-R3]|uniref:YtxH domain-containing protein n=1 Tax=Hymenobacter sp. H14-R3 TaxID=3046308 RepID=UPI0024B9C153|nr:YtxH domain-containing protein [Hymenobacter sp. H14-R3]MDJ0367276.1 YtxH domain-containing protein [Hymenobacter sp. H14-R3]
MPNDNGKVIVSLLAGATAGILAGLLLAPETGDEARAGLRESARKWWADSLGKAHDALGKAKDAAAATNPSAAVREDRQAADALFDSMSNAEPGDLATPVGNGQSVAGDEDYDSRGDLDYDGDAGEGRHRAL